MGDDHNKIIITKQSTEAGDSAKEEGGDEGERERTAYTPSRNPRDAFPWSLVSRDVAHELIAIVCGANTCLPILLQYFQRFKKQNKGD